MSGPLCLPLGAKLVFDADSLSIQHDGDVVLEQTLGRRLTRVRGRRWRK